MGPVKKLQDRNETKVGRGHFSGHPKYFISSAEVSKNRVNQKTGCAPFTAGEQEQREVEGKKEL